MSLVRVDVSGLVVTALALLVLFSAGLLVFACRRDTIIIWIYSKSWARRFFSEDLIDKDKPYDAFLSYSHADAEAVTCYHLITCEGPNEILTARQILCEPKVIAGPQYVEDELLRGLEDCDSQLDRYKEPMPISFTALTCTKLAADSDFPFL